MNRKDCRKVEAVHNRDYRREIVDLLRSNLCPKAKEEMLHTYHEKDIATALEVLDFQERRRLYFAADAEILADILAYAEDPVRYIGEIEVQKRMEVLSRFEAAKIAEYIRKMEPADRALATGLLNENLRAQIRLFHSFGEDEIGCRMTTNYISVREGSSVREAMRVLIRQAADCDNTSTIYVVDEKEKFLGAIDLKDLIIAREGSRLSNITMTSYPYVYAGEQIEECLGRIVEYSEDFIPVLDTDNRLIGVLTSQALMELVDDEMGEDYAKLGGLSAEEDLNESLKRSIRKRLPWLVILLGLGMVVSSVVGVFEGVVARIPLIIAFQSLILDMAGNVGTQSLAVTIRVLMDEKVSRKQKVKLIFKESRIGLVNGVILGGLSFLLIGIYLCIVKGQTAMTGFSISACTGAALLLAMMLSSLSGTLVPLMFQRMKVDPAVASGPLITTINDLVAVISYYGLAWLLLIRISWH